MPTAFVTGATGFIGQHLVHRLSQNGWRVHVLVRPGGEAKVGGAIPHPYVGATEDLLTAVAQAKPDVVFHLASLFLADHTPEAITPLIQANVFLGTQLLEAMRAAGVKRLVNTGTSWQHFNTPDYRPVNLYAATKQAFEAILAHYHDAEGLSCITLKLFDTYGPGDTRRKLIRILLDALGSDAPLAMSPGDQLLELTHVDDVVAGFLQAAGALMASAAPRCDAYALSGERLSVKDLVARVGAAAGRPLAVQWGGRPYRSREVMVPMDPTGCLLPGWTPQVPLEAGLRQLLAERGL